MMITEEKRQPNNGLDLCGVGAKADLTHMVSQGKVQYSYNVEYTHTHTYAWLFSSF